MKAIILAAGRGSRMKDKTEALPKCLTRLWGKTLLDWQLNAIKNAGINDIAVVTGYRANEIAARYPNLNHFHSDVWDKTQMVATLMRAEPWLTTDDCIVSYADIVYTSKAIELLRASTADIAITYHTKFLELWSDRFDNPLDDIETFKLDGNSNLIEIGRRARSLDEIEGQYMGLLKFTPEGWSAIARVLASNDLPKGIERIDMTGLLSFMLSRGETIKAIAYDEIFLEVDNPEDLALYESWTPDQYGALVR
ncbi:MAG: phosphocholine cytidylyltransferase family protein [Selenomonadaceae bacterium]|nr:phosphocholine cytidylyltransferase family protein [Selenomonadaceae bacterium]